MRRLLLLALLSFPLLAQTPTPTPTRTPTVTPTVTPTPTRTPTVTPTITPTPTPFPAPSKYSLATQVRPGFGTISTEPILNKLGDTFYAQDWRTFARLAGNITATRKFSCQLGTGTVSAAPGWCAITGADVPTLNQNTTGSAAKWTTARLLAGNSVDGSANVTFPNKFILQGTTDTGMTGSQFLGALTTGIVKNTTTTGVLSIASTGDFPTLNQNTTGGAAKLLTTSTAVDVSGSAAPSGSSQACVTTDTTHCTWQTILLSGGSGNVTVATKGDLQGYSTTPANLSVGANGTVPMADSVAAVGLSYQWPGIGTLRTLKETVFAGITPASYSNGSTTTIDGSGYTCAITGNGAVDMVATGLRLRRGTTSSTGGSSMAINAGNTGDFASIVGETRMRRGNWGLWIRLASWDFTNTASGTSFSELVVASTSNHWGFSLRPRARNVDSAPNTTTGGIACAHWVFGAVVDPACYPGVSTADVLFAYVVDDSHVDFYYGTYSAGWPTIEAMSFLGRVSGAASTFYTAATSIPSAALMNLTFNFTGSANTTTGTAEVIFDRWRITTWE